VRVELDVVRAEDPGHPLSSARAAVGDSFVVASHHVVVDPAIYRALLGARLEEGETVAVAHARDGRAAGPILASRAALDSGLDLSAGAVPAELSVDGKTRRIDTAGWSARVDTEAGRSHAFRELFEACRKPVDGVVARHVNRHISIFISKRIVDTALTPNQTSVLTFLLGVAAAVLAARGGYWNTLWAAFLFQWNSILDGVDGELARVRFQHSTLGQWLDTVSDDLSNVLFYGGLAIGARALPFGAELAMLGWAAVVMGVVTAAIYYTEMYKLGSGDLYAIDWGFDKAPPPGIRGTLIIFFRYVLKKDFAILFFLGLALLGVLSYALVVIGVAQACVLVAAIGRRLRRSRAA
jgi:phosphatidylglycerophosphate synthase